MSQIIVRSVEALDSLAHALGRFAAEAAEPLSEIESEATALLIRLEARAEETRRAVSEAESYLDSCRDALRYADEEDESSCEADLRVAEDSLATAQDIADGVRRAYEGLECAYEGYLRYADQLREFAGGDCIKAQNGLSQKADALREAARIRTSLYFGTTPEPSFKTSGGVIPSASASASTAPAGPGEYKAVNESMSVRSAAYQTRITGQSNGISYVVNGVKFDGFDAAHGILLEAKEHYKQFVADGEFHEWFDGVEDLLKQAERQITAAGNWPIHWHVAEKEAADAIRILLKSHGLSRIIVLHTS